MEDLHANIRVLDHEIADLKRMNSKVLEFKAQAEQFERDLIEERKKSLEGGALLQQAQAELANLTRVYTFFCLF